MKTEPMEWKKILTNNAINKGLISMMVTAHTAQYKDKQSSQKNGQKT